MGGHAVTPHSPYLARKYWDVTVRGALADLTDATAMQLMFRRQPDFSLIRRYTTFLVKLDAGTLGIED